MRPRLVLVHGTRFSGSQWARYAELLPEAEVVTPDLPGHGARVGEPFTTEAAVRAIGEAVGWVAPAQPVVLAGHSLGGYMAMVYAARHPGVLSGLVLVGASAEPGGRAAVVYRAFAALLPHVGYERMARVANWVIRRLGAPADSVPDGAAYAATADAWAAVMEDCHSGLLADVDCPVVLVNGQYDQMRLHVRAFAGQCRDVRVVTVPRASHLLPLTHPAVLAGILRAALTAPD